MGLDERPEKIPDLKNGLFEDRIRFYMGYLRMKHESDIWTVSYICVLIFIASLVLLVSSIILLTDLFNIDWSFIGLFDIGKWLNDNSSTVFTVTLILSAVMAVTSMTAAVMGFKQEHYAAGLAALVILFISSVWTVIIPIISIILIVYYIRGEGSFFS